MRLRRVSRDVRRALDLAPGERVLAAGRTSDGTHVVATTQALHVEGARLPYDKILKAVWRDEDATLEVWEPSLDGGRAEITLADPGRLPETVRERVQATVLVSRQVLLRGGRGVLITARRRTDVPDVRWTMLFDRGLDSQDPAVRAAADAALADLRHQTGI